MPSNPSVFFKALSDETRLRIVLLLTQESELCVCELMAALEDSQPKVSRHLAQLRACGLLADRRQGQWIYYRLHSDVPAWLKVMLAELLKAEMPFFTMDQQRLEAMGSRPNRQTLCTNH